MLNRDRIISRMKTTLKRIIVILLAIYVGFGLFLFFSQRAILYHPDEQDFENCPGFADYQKLNHKGTRFYLKEKTKNKIVVYYHGNAESACDRSIVRTTFEQPSVSVMFVEYTGYANDGKKPSKNLILIDVENIVDFIEEKGFEKIVIYGQSIGSGAASYHAKIGQVDTLILATPFSSIKDVVRARFGIYPVSLILRETYDNVAWLENYSNKLVILQGDKDIIVPPRFSRKLFESAHTKDKQYILIEGARHNTVWEFPEFRDTIARAIIIDGTFL
jgi:esterase/lipase